MSSMVDLGATVRRCSLVCSFCRWCPDDRCSCKCQSCGRAHGAYDGCICPDGPTVRVKWDDGVLPCEGDWCSFFHESAFGATKGVLLELLELKLYKEVPKVADGRSCLNNCSVESFLRQLGLGGRLAARLDDADCIRRTWLRRMLTGRYRSGRRRRTPAL